MPGPPGEVPAARFYRCGANLLNSSVGALSGETCLYCCAIRPAITFIRAGRAVAIVADS